MVTMFDGKVKLISNLMFGSSKTPTVIKEIGRSDDNSWSNICTRLVVQIQIVIDVKQSIFYLVPNSIKGPLGI
jgi:hypothetical protein